MAETAPLNFEHAHRWVPVTTEAGHSLMREAERAWEEIRFERRLQKLCEQKRRYLAKGRQWDSRLAQQMVG